MSTEWDSITRRRLRGEPDLSRALTDRTARLVDALTNRLVAPAKILRRLFTDSATPHSTATAGCDLKNVTIHGR
jgi:hypothetical protein